MTKLDKKQIRKEIKKEIEKIVTTWFYGVTLSIIGIVIASAPWLITPNIDIFSFIGKLVISIIGVCILAVGAMMICVD